MNHKILIAVLSGLSLFAVAQSQTDKQKPRPSTSQTQSAPDAASNQAASHLEQKNVVHKDLAARNAAQGQPSGNKTGMDDWTQGVAKPASSGSGTKPSHVSAGDVNGDGMPDAVARKNSGDATGAAASAAVDSSKDQAPRDAASGQASGKRMHQPVTIMKETDKATPLAAASGQASGKRMHEPVTITKEVDKASPTAATAPATGKGQPQPVTVKKVIDKASPQLKQ